MIKADIIKELSDLNYKSKRKLARTRVKKFQEIDMGNNKLIENVSNDG